ncbi:uncharacterized protein LOC130710081 [Lotus japonicus]|uniref:uncharacterized protein LOC130710081 n=1 Tax=Lotus japonicus TaxID=34305 RepID=UPI002588010A|nr:uncharacterized protein LOC130710081 [Lotus japonicus]
MTCRSGNSYNPSYLNLTIRAEEPLTLILKLPPIARAQGDHAFQISLHSTFQISSFFVSFQVSTNMSQESGKQSAPGLVPVKNAHGVRFLGLKSPSSHSTRVTRSSSGIAAQSSSPGHSPTPKKMRTKQVVTKKKTLRFSPPQDTSPISESDTENVADIPDLDIVHAEDLLDLASARVSEPPVQSNVEKSTSFSEDSVDVHDDAPPMKKSVIKTGSAKAPPETSSRKGKEHVILDSDGDTSDDVDVTVKNIESRLRKKMKHATPVKSTIRTPKDSKAAGSVRKSKGETTSKGKGLNVSNKKRKHVSDHESDQDGEPTMPDISTTTRKRVKGKRVPMNVADVPLDNVSFHYADNAQRWKFVSHRRIAIERELSEEALEFKEIIDLLSKAELMKTVKGIGRCYEKLVREFIVNISSDYDDAGSAEFHKVFFRGKCVHLSPVVINEFLGRSTTAVAEGESDLNEIAKVISGKQVMQWPKKGLLPSGKLTAKFTVLSKIGAANWLATNHTSGITIPLAKLIFWIGTGAMMDFGQHVFEHTFKHVGSYAVKLSIMFPCLITELILQQHPSILQADEAPSKKGLPLNFDYRLFAGTHVPNIVLNAPKDAPSASGTKGVTSTGKDDILAELKEISKTLQATIQASKVRKHNVDQLIKMLAAPADDEVSDPADDEDAEADLDEEDDDEALSDDDNVEEEGEYPTDADSTSESTSE